MIRLFKVFIPVGALTLLVSEVLLVTSAFIFATYVALDVAPTVFLFYDGGLSRISLVVLSILIGLHLHDLYSQIYVKSRIVLLQQLCMVMGAAFLAQALIAYVHADLRVPVFIMLLGSAIAVVAIFSWRLLFSAFAFQVVGRDRLLLVGGGPLLEDIGQYIVDHPETGLEIAGYVDYRHEPRAALPGGKLLGTMESLRDIVRTTQPHRIVVGMFERRNRMPVGELLELRFAGNVIEEAANTYERVCGRVRLKEIRPSQLIFSGELGPHPHNLVYQRISNMAVAIVGIIVSSPIMLLTALAVRLSSPGAVLYRQTRVGLDGALFTVYKFRSMYEGSDKKQLKPAEHEDARITVVGKWLRRTRIDELPQLFNIVKGDMAFVGPRPFVPEQEEECVQKIPFYKERWLAKPGATGWAQINRGYNANLEDNREKLAYDLFYIKNVSFGLDLYIMFATVKILLLGRGGR